MKETDDMINVHNIRYYNLSPRAIHAIKYNSSNGKIALTRSDGSIEIWDITYAPTQEKTIPPENDKSSIEGICWFGDRLFSCDLTGEIVEYDLETLSRKRRQYVTGNSVWCLDVNIQKSLLAAGTEEGYLNIFDISGNNLMYQTVFDKQEGRILCCKFSYDGEFVVTGSLDFVRIWSTKTGNAIKKMATVRSEKKKANIVWSIQVLRDLTIISGDSSGNFIVWDGHTGTQIEYHKVFEKDILTLEVNGEENLLICAGVEAIIRIYCLTPITKNNQTVNRWVKFLQRHVHDHDVKALSFAGLKIISGGVDGFLGFSSYSKMHQEVKKYGPFLQNPVLSVAYEVRQILFRYPNTLEIWKLESSEQNMTEKLLEMKSKKGDFITCSEISPNGKWLIYSTSSSISLFSLNHDNNKINLTKVKVSCENFTPTVKILFSNNSKELYLFKENKTCHVYELKRNGPILQQEIDYSEYIKDVLYICLLSKDDQYLILAGTCKTINVYYKNENLKCKHFITLPKYSVPVTAIQIHPKTNNITTVYSDGKIVEYNLFKKKIINSNMLMETDFTLNAIKNILLSENDKNKFVLQSENELLSCQWDRNLDKIKQQKMSKSDGKGVMEKSYIKVNLKKSYDNLIETKWLSDNEIIIIGVNPVSLIELLPSTYKKKVFGAS